MKFQIGLLILLIHSATFAAGQDFESFKDSVVKVKAGGKTGTGFIIQVQETRIYVLTAYHVVVGQSDIEVFFHRDPYVGWPVRAARNQATREDLSVLVVDVEDTRGLSTLVLKQDLNLDTTTPAYAIGFYGGGSVPWAVTDAHLIDRQQTSILFAGAIKDGNSGGPLIQDGEVIGIVTRKGRDHNFATPAILAQYFIEGVLGVLPVKCNAPLIPPGTCVEYIHIDRSTCDDVKRANRLYVDGDYDRAIAAYDKSIDAGSDYAVLFNNRGVIKLTQKDFEGAAEDFERALRRDPDYVAALANQSLAKTYLLYFQTLDTVSTGGEAPNPLLELLQPPPQPEGSGSPEGGGPATDGQGGLAGVSAGITRLLYAMAAPQLDSMKMEALTERFKKGDMTCYGGDMLAANSELNLKMADDLMGFFDNYRQQLNSQGGSQDR